MSPLPAPALVANAQPTVRTGIIIQLASAAESPWFTPTEAVTTLARTLAEALRLRSYRRTVPGPMPVSNVEEIELEEQHALVVHREFAPQDIGRTLADILPRVARAIAEQGAEPVGMPFMRYFSMDGKSMRAAAGMPVRAPLRGSGDIEPHILPGGRALTATHLGDYEGVGAAWQRVWDRARELGAEVRFGGWDVYANDPESVAPEEIETRIHLPLPDTVGTQAYETGVRR